MIPNGGDLAELARRGQVYAARSGAAAVITVPGNTAPTLWNPAGSGKIVYLYYINLTPATLGAAVLGGLTLSYLSNTGSVPGTASPVATFTNIPPVCTRIGFGAASKTMFANATVTFTAAPTVFMDIGVNHWLEGTAATGQNACISLDMKGAIVLFPGNLITLNAVASVVTTYWTTFIFAELPVPVSV
jgi:hypothetical protein